MKGRRSRTTKGVWIMSKKAIKTILAKGIDKVVSVISGALETVESGGNVVTQVCNIAKQIYRGESIPAADMKYICGEVAKRRGWSEKSAKIRMSEVRTVLNTYTQLPDAIVKFKKQSPTFSWHNAMMLARALKANPSAPTKAVSIALGRVQAGTKPKGGKTRVAILMKSALNTSNIPAELKQAIYRLCKAHNLNVGTA
jgi:hypothetical protein